MKNNKKKKTNRKNINEDEIKILGMNHYNII